MASLSNNYNLILIFIVFTINTHAQTPKHMQSYIHCTTYHHTIGSITLGRSAYGEGIGYISVTHIGCFGTEDNITSCDTDSISTCSHSEDASVICRGMDKQKDVMIKLLC